MLFTPVLVSGLVASLSGCGTPAPAPPPARPAVELRDPAGVVQARVERGRPCRAQVAGLELLVGAQPFVAQHGAVRWTARDDADGTTFLRDGIAAARLYSGQVFDADGAVRLRVTPTGELADARGASRGHAAATPRGIRIASAAGEWFVTGTSDVLLAAILAAGDVGPEVRALAACHFIFSEEA